MCMHAHCEQSHQYLTLETAMTDEEAVHLKAMFNEVGARPKARTKEEL